MKTWKKISFAFLFSAVLTAATFAKTPLRTEDSVPVREGRVGETGILADPEGKVFLEFLEDTFIVNGEDRQAYEGDILPPAVVAIPDEHPRPRMREILTFELIGETAEDLLFIDKLHLSHPTQQRRIQFLRQLRNQDLDPDVGYVQALIPYQAEAFGHAILWEYVGSEGWRRLGGKNTPSSQEDFVVFSAKLRGTGVFTLFDEKPFAQPVDPVNPDDVILLEESPFPSVDQDFSFGDDFENQGIELGELSEFSEEESDFSSAPEDGVVIPSLEEAQALSEAEVPAPIPVNNEPAVIFENEGPLGGLAAEGDFEVQGGGNNFSSAPENTSSDPFFEEDAFAPDEFTDDGFVFVDDAPPGETASLNDTFPLQASSFGQNQNNLPRSGPTEKSSALPFLILLGVLGLLGASFFWGRKTRPNLFD